MTGDMLGLSRLGYQPYQGPMPFQFQGGMIPGAANTGVTGIGAANPFSGQGYDSFNSSFFGMSGALPSPGMMTPSLNMGMGMGTPAISGSTLQLMAQINSMMASVMQGLMSFVQTLMASAAKNPAGTGQPGVTSTNGTSPEGTSGSEDDGNMPAPGNQAESAVQWALEEEKKGISEADDQAYISKTYSKGKVEAWCADFVSTAFAKTGGSPFGHMPAVRDIKAWGQKNGKYMARGQGTPKRGQIVIFQKPDGTPSHTGLVVGVENGKLVTVEGNASDRVKKNTYALGSGYIAGYVNAV